MAAAAAWVPAEDGALVPRTTQVVASAVATTKARAPPANAAGREKAASGEAGVTLEGFVVLLFMASIMKKTPHCGH
jgi:hypothetical protein